MEQQLEARSDATIRWHRPGDLGHVLHHHGLYYSQFHGYNHKFEAHVAKIVSDFLENYDSTKERCFIAEEGEQFLGSVMLVKDPDDSTKAKLRLLLVDEKARGKGIGSKLVAQCISFARETGYHTIELSTVSALQGAIRIYTRAGFERIHTEKINTWGAEAVAEQYRLKLRSEAL
jgi:ribosomal protein S18 acetylase RimI-like enzyme